MKKITGFAGFVLGFAFAITLMAIVIPIGQTKANDLATGQGSVKVEPTIDPRMAQPQLEKSLNALRAAKSYLPSSVKDKNGHRDAAIKGLDQAIAEWITLMEDVRNFRAG